MRDKSFLPRCRAAQNINDVCSSNQPPQLGEINTDPPDQQGKRKKPHEPNMSRERESCRTNEIMQNNQWDTATDPRAETLAWTDWHNYTGNGCCHHQSCRGHRWALPRGRAGEREENIGTDPHSWEENILKRSMCSFVVFCNKRVKIVSNWFSHLLVYCINNRNKCAERSSFNNLG